jgi:hypothetical protein
LVAMTRAGSLQIAIPSKSQGPRMIRTTPEQNKTLVIEAFDTLSASCEAPRRRP